MVFMTQVMIVNSLPGAEVAEQEKNELKVLLIATR